MILETRNAVILGPGVLELKLPSIISILEFRYSCYHLLGKFKVLFQLLPFRICSSIHFFPGSSLYGSLAAYPPWPPSWSWCFQSLIRDEYLGWRLELKPTIVLEQRIETLDPPVHRLTRWPLRVYPVSLFSKVLAIHQLYLKKARKSTGFLRVITLTNERL